MKKTLFKEHRLIYQNKSPESPGMFDALGKLGDAAGTLANSFAGLVDTVTRGLSRGVDLADVGIAKIEKGIAILSEKIADPGEPTDLPEYEEMPTLFTRPTSTGNKDLDEALMMQLRLIFLQYKANEYAEFIKPARNQFQQLKSKIDHIDYKKKRYRPRIEELTRLIENRETTINSGNLLKTSPMRIDLETELAAYKSEKEQLQRESSYEVMWPKPQYQKTEFPPGSGEYINRLIFDPKQKVKIDLNALYGETGVYLDEYKIKFEEYEREMKRLLYHSNRIIEHADKSRPNWSTENASLESQLLAYRNSINTANITFRTQGSPTDVGTLAGTIRRSASTAAPTPSRPIPTRSAQDDLNLLP